MKLLRFAALLLFAVMGSQLASAQWVQPTPTVSPLTTTDSVYIYNAAQKRWFGRGEAWTTQLILTNEGAITTTSGSVIRSMLIQLEDGTYQITSNPDGGVTNSDGNPVSGTNTLIWRQPNDGTMGNVPGCFTDGHLGGDKPNHLTGGAWVITDQGNNSYTIAAPAGTDGVSDGMVLGYQEGHASNFENTWGLYYDVTYAGNEANCQFQFVTEANFQAYAAEYARYQAAQTLADLIEEARALGVDVSAYEAIHGNTSATLAELNQAIDNLRTDIGNSATWDAPQDVTNMYITNPNPVRNIDGYMTEWLPNAFDAGNNCAECWGHYLYGGMEIKQTMQGLPSGVYTLTMTALTRTGFDAKFFVGEDSVQIAQVPSSEVNSRSGANTWFNEGYGRNTISFYTLGDSTDVTFGWRIASQSDYWTVWRDFQLLSYGTSLESFQHLSESFVGEDWAEEFGDATYCDDYFNAVSDAIAANQGAATKEEAVAAFEATKQALNDLRENIRLLKELEELANDLDVKNYDLYNGFLSDVIDEANLMIDDCSATNEEIQAMIDLLHEKEREAVDQEAQPGADITDVKIVNPTFSEGGTKEQDENGDWYVTSTEGWTLIGGQGGENYLNGSYGVAESWMGNFDVSQPITLAKGAYELKTRGFYRTSSDPDYNAPYRYWLEANGEDTGDNTVRAEIYASANASKFVNIFSVPYTTEQKDAVNSGNGFVKSVVGNDSCWTPGNQASAREAFKSPTYGPRYETGVKFIALGTDRPVTIGLRAQNIMPTGWSIWDNVQLIFTGRDEASLKEALDATIAYNESLVAKPMAAATKAALQEAIATALAANDEDAIYAAEEALEAAVPAANASVVKYDSLSTAKANLDEAITLYEATAFPEAVVTAKSLQAEIAAALDNGSIDDADISAKIVEINEAIAKLRVPDYSGATMDSPVEMTSVIVNPDFADNNTTSAEGWTYTGSNSDFVNTNIAQTWNQDADIYQTISHLPKGLYQVLCQGFYQYGTYDNDTAAFYHDQDMQAAGVATDSLKINGYLFANGDSVALQHIIFCPRDVANFSLVTSTPVDNNWKAFVERGDEEQTIFYIPNNRAEAANRFQTLTDINSTDLNHDGDMADPAYLNSVYCYVDESGQLTLGFFNHSHVTRDWTAATNFQLFYFGDGDDTRDIAGTTGIDALGSHADGTSRYFTVDGRQVNSLQRGVNIVKTTAPNGKTTVRKVVVK